ncbi:secretin N-terminal domain-containing protein [Thermodesulfobacteriota bacterium]
MGPSIFPLRKVKRKYNCHSSLQRMFISFLLCLFFSTQTSTGICKSSTVIIQVQFRKASEVLHIVKDMLSNEGKASVDIRTNSVVIDDNPEHIQKIRSFLEKFDVPPEQVRVRVRFQEESLSKDNSLSAEGSVSGKGWQITTKGKKTDSVDIHLRDRSRKLDQSSEYFISVLSGSQAYILTGKDIIFRDRWSYLCKRYAGYVDTITVKRIESGFDVTPIIVGDRADIDITPRISHEVSRGRKEIIRFTKAATTLSVPLGQWFTISVTDESSNEVIREILLTGSRKKKSSLSISLMVEED